MFYLPQFDDELRFGDILTHQTTLSTIVTPQTAPHEEFGTFQIDVKKPTYSVVLTPCCSIGNELIVITPLKPVNKHFFTNPYLAEDLTRINRPMLANQAIPPIGWNSLSPEDQAKKLAEGNAYAFVETFIYSENEVLQKYPSVDNSGNATEISYYMIDFRNVSIINSKNIKAKDGIFVTRKIAQLAVEARSELRQKIAEYYGRIPKEDEILDD